MVWYDTLSYFTFTSLSPLFAAAYGLPSNNRRRVTFLALGGFTVRNTSNYWNGSYSKVVDIKKPYMLDIGLTVFLGFGFALNFSNFKCNLYHTWIRIRILNGDADLDPQL